LNDPFDNSSHSLSCSGGIEVGWKRDGCKWRYVGQMRQNEVDVHQYIYTTIIAVVLLRVVAAMNDGEYVFINVDILPLWPFKFQLHIEKNKTYT
jgi:hypothetical protein